MIALQSGSFDNPVENQDGSLTVSISFYVQSVGWCSREVTIQPTDTTDAIRTAMLQAILDHAAERGVKLDAASVFMAGTLASPDAVTDAVALAGAVTVKAG